MRTRNITRVKICCIASVAEARLAIKHGAAAIGLVAKMPSGPGVIPEATIARIAAATSQDVESFLLTSEQDAPAIIAQQRRCGTSAVQICHRLASSAYEALRQEMPGVKIVQVIHVTGQAALTEARRVEAYVDSILLDSTDPALPGKSLGGTGLIHDWRISRRIRETVALPVFLAGGLRPTNVAAAISTVQPHAVDVCTGVRTDGNLDETKLAAFMKAVKGIGPGAG
jgi:phosphoribosylanthranilate isomerase